MNRSRFSYSHSEAGGAADLQTDIMRFMAILSLCLMAIFALVQSIPIVPLTPAEEPPAALLQDTRQNDIPAEAVAEPEPQVEPIAPQSRTEKAVVLTRPKWQPETPVRTEAIPVTVPPAVSEPLAAEPAVEPPDPQGFSLRFESDEALMRLVATSKIGLYAIDSGRAQRMTVSDSRISFWNASTPNTFHEMESATVPTAVVDALARTGTASASVSWGVTLPGKLRTQLDALMKERSGGDLVIGKDGHLRLEES